MRAEDLQAAADEEADEEEVEVVADPHPMKEAERLGEPLHELAAYFFGALRCR